jgi:hypothetical protein
MWRFLGYRPLAAGWKIQVAKPLPRQCGASTAEMTPGT